MYRNDQYKASNDGVAVLTGSGVPITPARRSSVCMNTACTRGSSKASTSAATNTCGIDGAPSGSRQVSSRSRTSPTREKVSMSRANQPQVSNEGARSMQPLRLTRACVGRRPITPQWLAGARTEPPVSVPSATSASPLDTAEAEPELEPPGIRSGAPPLRGVPKWAFLPFIENASSSVHVLPTNLAPACASATTTGAEAVLVPDSASICGLPQPVG